MRRIAATVVPLLIALMAGASASAAATRRKAEPSCPASHSQVLVADGRAEVYETYGLGIFGCVHGRSRAYELGTAARCGGGGGGCGGIKKETLTGPIVAYEEGSSSNGGPNESGTVHYLLVVRDLLSGRVLHRVATGTPRIASGSSEGIGPAVDIIIKGDGAMAWIVATSPEAGTYQVHAIDGSGNRLLASGSDINPYSLAVAGSTLYWTQGGEPFLSPLN